jgi:hypothetical protein
MEEKTALGRAIPGPAWEAATGSVSVVPVVLNVLNLRPAEEFDYRRVYR